MTTQEFSDTFDVLINSYNQALPFGGNVDRTNIAFTEFEKSLFLTKAQEEIVKSLYNGTATNAFEETEDLRRQLDALIRSAEYHSSMKLSTGIQDKYNHYAYELPSDCWFIIYEQAISEKTEENPCTSSIGLDVYPTTHDEYNVIRKNPYRGPNKRRVLRLDIGPLKVELVSALNIATYHLRYLSQPTPIILCDLTSEGLKIGNEDEQMECSLPELLHYPILDRAVQLAIASKAK